MKNLFTHLVLIFLLLANVTFPQVPRIINYQGILLDSNKQPVAEGDYKLTFNLYDKNDSLLWSEIHNQVFVSEGMFHVLLGTVNLITLDFNQPYFLGIQVENDPEMQPRMMMTSAAYSFNADRVGGISASTTPEPNKLYPLGNDGRFPASVLPVGNPGGNFIKKNVADTTRGSSADDMLRIENTGAGRGLTVISANSHGIYGKSGSAMAGVEGENSQSGPGIRGYSKNQYGAIGYSEASDKAGVYGNNADGNGVWGNSQNKHGVFGFSTIGRGVKGESAAGGVLGESTQGVGVEGRSNANDGVLGWTNSPSKSGVYGTSPFGNGVTGRSDGQDGILGVTTSSNTGHAGVHARNEGSGPAIYSEGDIYASGKVYGNIGPYNGGPFPRPAFNSGWLEVHIDDTGFWHADLNINDYLPTITYDNDNFFIEVMTKTSGKAGNQFVDWVEYYINPNNSLRVSVFDSNKMGFITHVRLRLWYIK